MPAKKQTKQNRNTIKWIGTQTHSTNFHFMPYHSVGRLATQLRSFIKAEFVSAVSSGCRNNCKQ